MTEASLDGGCYCGAVRYRIAAEPVFKGQCHCRACTHISGGEPNYFLTVPEAGVAYARGVPASLTRDDIERPVTREFGATCGTHLVTRRQGYLMAIVKAGTLDDPAEYGGPSAAIYSARKQPYHLLPAGVPQFDELPSL
jgi:hypothetical protein